MQKWIDFKNERSKYIIILSLWRPIEVDEIQIWMFCIKSPHLRLPKIIFFRLECHLIMTKCSFEVRGPSIRIHFKIGALIKSPAPRVTIKSVVMVPTLD
jgi:hypothetical protein